MKFLKNHPFAVEAFFDQSLVLSFAVPVDELKQLIPSPLELDSFQGKWGFIAVAMVQASGLRPKGFPKFMGNDFFLIGYRIFVRYRNKAGKNLRGLYILKSETNKVSMQILGNIFTHYNYSTTDIKQQVVEGQYTVRSEKSRFQLEIDQASQDVQIPKGSPFDSWKSARKFAGPLPFTFYLNAKDNTILIVEGVRKNWKPRAVKVNHYEFDFLNNLGLKNKVLANAFVITDTPYYWKKGVIEKWM